MSTKNTTSIFHALVSLPQRVIQFISGAAIRIFSSSDDNYPATGMQPFEGDPANKKLL